MPNKQFNKTHLKTLVQFWKQFLTILILLLFPYNMWILLPLQFCAAKTSTSHPHSPKRAPNTQYWPLRKASFTPFLAIGDWQGDPKIWSTDSNLKNGHIGSPVIGWGFDWVPTFLPIFVGKQYQSLAPIHFQHETSIHDFLGRANHIIHIYIYIRIYKSYLCMVWSSLRCRWFGDLFVLSLCC